MRFDVRLMQRVRFKDSHPVIPSLSKRALTARAARRTGAVRGVR